MTYKGYLAALALSLAVIGGGAGSDHEGEIITLPCDRCGEPSVTETTYPSRCDDCLHAPDEGGG